MKNNYLQQKSGKNQLKRILKTKSSFQRISLQKTLLIILLFITTGVFAGNPPFQEVWKTKVPFSPAIHKFTHNDDLSLILCSTKKILYMINGKTGQKLWEMDIPNTLGVKSAEYQYWSQDAGVIVVFADDKKKSNSFKYFINDRSGQIMWKSDKYVAEKGEYSLKNGLKYSYDASTKTLLLCSDESIEVVKASSGDVVWTKRYAMDGKEKYFDCYYRKYYNLVCVDISKEECIYLDKSNGSDVTDITPYFDFESYISDRENTRNIVQIPEKNMFVTLQFKRSIFFGLAKRKMTVSAYEKGTNRLIWTNEISCSFVYDLYSTNTYRPIPVVDISYSNGKISLAYEGLSVLDANTGKLLWEAEFEITDNDFGLSKDEQVLYASPFPVFQDGNAFVFNKDERKLICYDAEKGTQIWESEKSSRTDYIDGLYVYDNVAIVQLGGVALVNTRKTITNGNYTYYIYGRGYQLKGDFGLYAYNKKDGKEVWSHKTIKDATKDGFKTIYGSYFYTNKLFVITDKNVLCLNPKDGSSNWQTPVKSLKIGKVWRTHFFEEQNKIVLDCEKGVAVIDASSGKVLQTIKIKNVNSPSPEIGDDSYSDYFIYTNGKAEKLKEFGSVNLETGKINGVQKIWNSDAYLENFFSWDGEYFIIPDGSNCSLLKVKP